MSVQLLDWLEVKPAEIERLARHDAALGVIPILILIEPSGDARIVSPLSQRATGELLGVAARELHRKELQ